MSSPASLIDLPAEIKLHIFRYVTATTTSSQDLISLAVSSKSLYQCFKENEIAVLRGAVIDLIASCRDGKADGVLADYFIKLAVLRSREPWPLDPGEIRRALAPVADSSSPLGVRPSMCGGILAWIRLVIKKPGVWMPRFDAQAGDGDVMRHAFDSIRPWEVVRIGRNVYCHRLRKALRPFEQHLEARYLAKAEPYMYRGELNCQGGFIHITTL